MAAVLKNREIAISQQWFKAQAIATKFGMMSSHIDPFKPVYHLNFEFKRSRWRTAPILKIKRSPYCQFIARSVLSESCFVLLVDLVNAVRQVKWYFLSAAINSVTPPN